MEKIKNAIHQLIDRSQNVYVASIDEDGFPNVKAMFHRNHEDYRVFYFSTNLSSKRASQFIKNAKASIYYCDEDKIEGVMLTGKMEVCTDYETKKLIWQNTDVMYYPAGIEDEDYCVFRFTAEHGNYYYGLNNTNFDF